MSGPDDRRQTLLVCALLVVLTLAAFSPVTRNGFVSLDDHEYILENSHVTQGLTWEGIRWALTATYAGNWHPLTWISHMLDCQLYGVDNPAGHHLTNVLLHVTNTLLLFVLFKRMTGAVWRCAFVAALFALHPAHVESVAWASERKDVLSTLFWLLTMLAYVSYVKSSDAGHRARARWSYLLALIFLALGLMAKSMLVTLPFVLLLADFWPLNRGTKSSRQVGLRNMPWKLLLIEKVPFFILAAFASYVTFHVQQSAGAMATMERLPLTMRAGNAALSYVRYIGKTVLPTDLAVFYPYPPLESLAAVLVSAILLCTISALFTAAAIRRPYLFTGWFWFLGTLVPTIGLVQVGSQSMADRYLYIPSIGLTYAVVWGLNDLLSAAPKGRRILAAAGIAFLVLCLPLTFKQVRTWKSSETLFRQAAEVTVDNYVAYAGLGGALGDAKQYPEAMEVLLKAVQVKPSYLQGQYNLGTVLLAQGRAVEGIEYFKNVLSTDPNFAPANANMGKALLMLGKKEEALPYLQKAVQLKPDYAEGYYNLGTFFLQQASFDQAVEGFSKAILIKPEYVEAHANLGVALMLAGKQAEGIEELAKAAVLNPDDAGSHANLGLALIEVKRFGDAASEFSTAIRIKPQDFRSRYNLGMALAGQHKTKDAIDAYRGALRVTTNDPLTLNNLAWILCSDPDPALRNGAEAVQLAERACQLTGNKQAGFILTLANAHAEAGQFAEATAAANQGREIARGAGDKAAEARADKLLELFVAGKPFREPQ